LHGADQSSVVAQTETPSFLQSAAGTSNGLHTPSRHCWFKLQSMLILHPAVVLPPPELGVLGAAVHVLPMVPKLPVGTVLAGT
jgi:hypothetical protein